MAERARTCPWFCGLSMRNATRTIAVLSIIGGIGAFSYDAFLVSLFFNRENRDGHVFLTDNASLIAALLLGILAGVGWFVIGIILIMGANQLDTKKCKIWIICEIITIIIFAIRHITYVAEFGLDFEYISATLAFGGVALASYFIWVVKTFMTECEMLKLQQGQGFGAGQQPIGYGGGQVQPIGYNGLGQGEPPQPYAQLLIDTTGPHGHKSPRSVHPSSENLEPQL